MSQARDKNAQLSEQEIDAIKINQDIIKRKAESSQKTKNFFLGISAAFFVLLGRGAIAFDWQTWCAFSVIVLTFWIIDARYLRLERQFREHHKAILSGALPSLENWDFSPARYNVASTLRIMFSFSELPYPAMICVILLFA